MIPSSPAFVYLCRTNGDGALFKGPFKRESGENPGQTRCCEISCNILEHFCHWLHSREGFRMEISQNTCHFDISQYARGLVYGTQRKEHKNITYGNKVS